MNRPLLDPWKNRVRVYLVYEQTLARAMQIPCSTLFGLWTDPYSIHEKTVFDFIWLINKPLLDHAKTVLDFIWLMNRPLLEPWKDRVRLYLAYKQTLARPMQRPCSNLFGLWTDPCSTHEKTVFAFIWFMNRPLQEPCRYRVQLYLAYEQTLTRSMKRPCSTLFGL